MASVPGPLLAGEGLTKSFAGVHALAQVGFMLNPGERLAVVGENGAGKSTLMKLLAGVFPPDTGAMRFMGQEYRPKTPGEAAAAGVTIVHQEPAFFSELSVLENVFAGRETRSRWGNLQWKAMRAEAARLFEQLNIPRHLLGRRMGDLSLGNQQLVLIARAIHQKASVLILDEPTSILTDAEASKLFTLIDQHAAAGGGVIYITHRLSELRHVADRLIILKDGRLVGEMRVDQASEQRLVELMGGSPASEPKAQPAPRTGSPPVLRVRGLEKAGLYHDISFDVLPGEIVGFYGLIGSGRTEVALSIFGALQPDKGSVEFEGIVFQPASPAAAVARGVAYVPEDRKTQGIFPMLDTGKNLSASVLRALSRFSIVNQGAERDLVQRNLASFRIKARAPTDPILSLSGGSQQKVILARWLATEPKLLILDEPTRGIDIGTKAEIHHIIRELAEKGLPVLLISSELTELLALVDRVYVLKEGRIMAELSKDQATENSVLTAAMGALPTNVA